MKDRDHARHMDEQDPLGYLREHFRIPNGKQREHRVYLCNNSLGLQPKRVAEEVNRQLNRWAELGVEGWFDHNGWYQGFDSALRNPLAQLLGAHFDEVVFMNTLTANLHLLLTSFFQPRGIRNKILIDAPTFPSDLYAIKSQLMLHGLDPDEALLVIAPRSGEHLIRTEDVIQTIQEHETYIALVFLNAVNYLTGQVLDTTSIAKHAKDRGCLVGLDLAHAAGNIPLKLSEDGIDFAVGCSYKYLNSGPGGVGFAFVHRQHHTTNVPRLAGWWGNDPKARFNMHTETTFHPHGGAASWQISTPPVLAFASLLPSMQIFQEVEIEALREKSMQQTAFLLEMLDRFPPGTFEVITPRDPSERGCQLSLLFERDAQEVVSYLSEHDVICDYRPPNVLRVSPSPLHNTFEDLCYFVETLTNAVVT